MTQQFCIRSKEGAVSSPDFINEIWTKYMFVGIYPAREYRPLVDFGIFRRGVGP